MTEEQAAAAKSIGKTIKAVASESSVEGCYAVRIDFADGSELEISGGFYDGTLQVQFTPSTDSQPLIAPQVRACHDG